MPGAGTAAGSIFDAAVPSGDEEQPTVDTGAQEKQGVDWNKLGGAAFGAVGEGVMNMLNPQEQPMQPRPSITPQLQQDEQRRLQERYKFMRGQYGNVQ
jgi:hypothetical protein